MNNVVAKERESNIELLRILYMFGVIISHALQSLYELHTTDFSMENNLRIVIMNASVVAVNCFVFISGYFRIRQSWRGFFSLYTQLLFYEILSVVIGILVIPEYSLLKGATLILFPLTGNGMWFIPVYFALYLLAPMLNISLEHQDIKGKRLSLLMLIIVDVYIGYMHQIEEVSVNGYHLIHFITLYYLGAYMKDLSAIRVNWGRAFLLLVFIGAGLHAIKMLFPPIAIIYSMRYNSPYVMLTSISLFQWISKQKIKSRQINNISKSVFSVYIISSIIPGYYSGLHWVQDNTSYWGTAVMIPLFIIVYYALCLAIDKIRITCCQPIVSWISNNIVKFEFLR